MVHSTPIVISQPRTANVCPAKTMGPEQRRDVAVQALAGTMTISQLAEDHDVSRKFIYQQTARAEQALDEAFASQVPDDRVLFYLPVTKNWLRQLILALVLLGHSSVRGVLEILRDVFAVKLSLGTMHNVLQRAVTMARNHNQQYRLDGIDIGAHDEIFQAGQPVLVGADVASTFCYLLSLEEHRDATTWGVRLLELHERGLDPDAIIADAGSGLRAGQAEALPDTPCWSDVFHAAQEGQQVVTFLDNRAYGTIGAVDKLEHKQAKARPRGKTGHSIGQKLRHARNARDQAVTLADDVRLLLTWLHRDVLSVAGPVHAERRALYDFIVEQLEARQELCPHRLKPLCRYLKNQRDDLLAFAAELDAELADLAREFQVAAPLVHELLELETLNANQPQRWQKQAELHRQLGARFHPLQQAVAELAAQTVRASSVIENLNSRLRNYFFLRRQLGPDYLELLQFFLNHRRFARSEHASRVGKSPAELLTGQAHPHWIEMLGYQRFQRN